MQSILHAFPQHGRINELRRRNMISLVTGLKKNVSAPARVIAVILAAGLLAFSSARAQKIFAGPDGYSGCAIDANGNLYTWGIDQYFQTVVNSPSGNAQDLTPIQIGFPNTVTKWITASVGYLYTLAVGNDGNAYAWGLNTYGQLGNGDTTNSSIPVMVKLPSGVKAEAVSAGESFAMALGSDGNVYAWGLNSSGQLGDSTTTNSLAPVRVKLPSGVTAKEIFAAPAFSLAIGNDGNIYAWGSNVTGQLGDGTTTSSFAPVKVKMPAGVAATEISAGSSFSLAIGSNGDIYAWGGNGFGQLGNGTKNNSSVPVLVSMPAGVTGKAVAGGRLFSAAVGSDGNVYAWGDNLYGELANGTVNVPKTDSIPQPIALPSGLVPAGLSAVRWSGFVLGTDNDVYSWGYNQEGELGVGMKTGAPKYALGNATVIPNFVLVQPGRPILLSPSNNAVNQPTSLRLKWSRPASATKYLCLLSSDRSFATNLVLNDSSVVDTTDTATGLAGGTKYYWHVLAENNGVMGAFSTVDSFLTAAPIPSKTILVSPAISATGVPRLAMFEWNTSPYATTYVFQIASNGQTLTSGDSIGAFLPQNTVFDTTVSDTSVQLASPLLPSSVYYWHVAPANASGMGTYSDSSVFTTGTGLTGVTQSKGIPKEFALKQNYPNPFNPSTTIQYSLPKAQMVTLKIYNVLGQEVATLVNARQSAGYYTVNFNAELLASGIYFCVLRTDNFSSTQKMMLLK
jgi:hypothetical protein